MAVQISGNDITVPRDGSFTRNVTIGGTLTYEDVTNIDSVGLVTARNGIEIGARPGVAASISVDGNMIISGISTFGGDVQVPDKIIHSGDTNTAIRFPAADTITAETGGSERARIDSTGRVRIGCTAQPSTTVSGAQFDAGGKTLRISEGGGTSSTTGSSLSITGGGGSTSIGAAAAMGAVLSLINCNNTDNNQTSIDFMASTELSTAKVIGKNDSHSSRNGSLIFATSSGAAPAERVRIDSAGRVGIKNTNMSSFNTGMDDLVIGNGTNGTSPGMTFYSNSSDIGSISFRDSADTGISGLIQYRHMESPPYMRFVVENSNIAKFTTHGGIAFGSDTAAANTLDDYEEGTYTPTLSCTTSGSITLNTSYNKMAYEKIGNWINVHGRVRVSSTSSPSGGQLRFSLPYQSKTFAGEGDAGRIFGVATIQNGDENENHYGIGPTINGETYVQIHNINTNNTNAIDVCSQVNSNSLIAINVTYRTT